MEGAPVKPPESQISGNIDGRLATAQLPCREEQYNPSVASLEKLDM